MTPALLRLLSLAAAAGLLTASSAMASAPGAGPAAHASGGDPPPVIPAIVRTRVKRAGSALDRLSGNVDDGDAVAATSTGKVLCRQLAAAWRGVKYTIKHAPPPVAGDARVRPARAHASGDGGAVAPVVADPPTVGLAVFALQDDVVSGIVGLLDGASAPLVTALEPTLTCALAGRDAAIEDVHALAPAPAADDARVRAHAAGTEGVVTFATVMPQVPPMLDDELQQIDALQADAGDLLPAGKRLLRAAEARIMLTERRVNAYWPPVSADS
jgi:hypothetical protein